MTIKYFALVLSLTSLLLVACSSLSSQEEKEEEKKNIAAANFNVQLGVGYLAQGDTQRAKRKLLLALQQRPDWPPALDAMAYFLEKTGEPKKAEKYYLMALSEAPRDGSALNNYGTFLCRTGQYREANKYFMRAVQDPNYLSLAEAYENAGLCSLKIPDNQLALQYFRKAVLQDPSRDTPLLELSDLHYQASNYLLADNYIKQYLNLATEGSPRAFLLKINIAEREGDRAAVAKYTQLLRQRYPLSKEARDLKTVS